MKTIGVLALLLSAVALGNINCDVNGARHHAGRIDRYAFGFSQAVTTVHGYTHLSFDATKLHEAASSLAYAASQGGHCLELQRQYRDSVTQRFYALESLQRAAQLHYPNTYLARYFSDIHSSFIALGSAMAAPQPPPPPPPPPPADPCYRIGGHYYGTCRVIGGVGTSAVNFYVGNVGGQCLAYNSNYFQPATLHLGPTSGVASVMGLPGGVAIINTSLSVYGGGRFELNGYNYAGKFYFTCSQ